MTVHERASGVHYKIRDRLDQKSAFHVTLKGFQQLSGN